MKRLIFFLFLVSNCFAQDTLLYENYQYKEVIVDTSDIWDWPNNNTELLPALSSPYQYYDVFRVILEWNGSGIACKWDNDYVFVALNNQAAFVPNWFMTDGGGGPMKSVVEISSFNGKLEVADGLDRHGYEALGNHQPLLIGLYYGTTPTQCRGYILVKIWYRIRTTGSAYN